MTFGGVLRSCIVGGSGKDFLQSAVAGLGGDYKDGLLVIILQAYMFILWVFLYLCFVLQFKKLQHLKNVH